MKISTYIAISLDGVNEITITQISILLGSGISLFGKLNNAHTSIYNIF